MSAPRMLVQLTADELAAIVRAEVNAALAAQSEAPSLLDQNALARELGVSARTVYTLRQQGLPVVWLLDSPRFDLAACLAWLRDQKPTRGQDESEPVVVAPVRKSNGKRSAA